MDRRGFTIVELAVVITIMGILLVLGVVNLNAAQTSARDSERKTDVETIATHLETFYKSGTDGSTTIGRYPSTVIIGAEQTMLRDINSKNLIAPGVDDGDNDINEHIVSTFIPATNNTQTTAGVTPQPTISQYVYQPLQSDGALCTSEVQECRKFNLFYRLEIDSAIYIVASKNQ